MGQMGDSVCQGGEGVVEQGGRGSDCSHLHVLMLSNSRFSEHRFVLRTVLVYSLSRHLNTELLIY